MKIIKCSITQGYIFIVRIIIFTKTCEYQSIRVTVLAFENIKVKCFLCPSDSPFKYLHSEIKNKIQWEHTLFLIFWDPLGTGWRHLVGVVWDEKQLLISFQSPNSTYLLLRNCKTFGEASFSFLFPPGLFTLSD